MEVDVTRKKPKYRPENLLPAMRLFVRARDEALELGFTDNGGAIHSVERIVDILGLGLRCPQISQGNMLKRHPDAEI